MMKAIRNWWTTVIGAIAGASAYLTTVGAKPPETLFDWGYFIFGLALAILGAVAKDGKTGSPPGSSD